MWLPYVGMLVPFRPEWWPPMTGQVAQSAPEYSFILEISSEAELNNKFNFKEDDDKVGLDRKTFELIAIGASIAANCKTCLEYHYETACKVGATPSEIIGAVKTGEMIREKPKEHLADVLKRITNETMSPNKANYSSGENSNESK